MDPTPPTATATPNKGVLQGVGTVISTQTAAVIAGVLALGIIIAITVMVCLNKTVPGELPNALYITLGGGGVALKTNA